MNLVLISVSGRLACDGSRLISALLKRAGHRVQNVYLARREPEYEVPELERLREIFRDIDLVMVAVYSNYFARAVKITDLVHREFPHLKVIWGGPHCIATPELSLKYADAVCFSEGEEAVLRLADCLPTGQDCSHIPNMAFRKNGQVVVNEVLPPFTDLDSLPYYDYSLDDQYLLDGDLRLLTLGDVKGLTRQYPFYVPTMYFLTSRGCPHECSYCNNCRYVSMFGKNRMRFYSVDRVIEEIKYTLGLMPFVEFVVFGDDDFLARPLKQLETFARRYKNEVGLPFGAAASPRTYRREKMELLLDHGLMAFNIGVQSGSQRVITEVYNRNISLTKTKEVVKELAPYSETRDLTVVADFIIDNPYETRDDVIKTYNFLLDLPESFKPNLFFLSLYPGTPIFERALKDGIIQEGDEEIFRSYTGSSLRYQKNYETFLVLVLRIARLHPALKKIPRWVFRLLGSYPVRLLASLAPASVWEKGADKLQLKMAWAKAKITGETAGATAAAEAATAEMAESRV